MLFPLNALFFYFSLCTVVNMKDFHFQRPVLGHGGPGSSVGIATGYRLDGPGIECQLGTRFSAPVKTGPGAQYWVFPGCKEWPGHDADPSPPSSAVVMKG